MSRAATTMMTTTGPTTTVMTERVAILVVTYDSADDLPGCLDAVATLEGHPIELVVVDCGSRDDSVALARQHPVGGLPKQVVPLGENRGFAGGMNAALAATGARWVLLLNPDARPEPDFVARLLALAASQTRVGAVTGRLVRPSEAGGRRLDACGMVLRSTWRHLDRGSGEIDRGQYGEAEEVFGATGAASLFGREALDDVAVDGKVFDEDFHSYREDAELCFRLQERGWRVLYEPRAVCEHRRRVTPERRSDLPAAINYHSFKNRYLLRAYHQTRRNFWRTLIPTAVRDLGALFYVILVERSSWAAYRWLWRNRKAIRQRRRRIQARRTAPPDTLGRWFREESKALKQS